MHSDSPRHLELSSAHRRDNRLGLPQPPSVIEFGPLFHSDFLPKSRKAIPTLRLI